jgi:hypothetical protein
MDKWQYIQTMEYCLTQKINEQSGHEDMEEIKCVN